MIRSTWVNSARSLTYIITLSRLSSFFFAIILRTQGQLVRDTARRCAKAYEESHILTMHLNHAINPFTSLNPIHYNISFPKYLKRAYILDSRSPPFLFPSSLIADPAKEAIKKVGRDFLKALSGELSNKDAVSTS